MIKLGLIDGKVVEIQVNDKFTHCFVGGKRIPCNEAKEAIEAYENSQKEIEETNSVPTAKDNLVYSLEDLRRAITTVDIILKEKSVNRKKELLKNNLTPMLRDLLIVNLKGYKIGVYYKRFITFSDLYKIELREDGKVDFNCLLNWIKKVTNDALTKRVTITKEEYVGLTKCVPYLPEKLGKTFFNLLNGKVKLAIPKKDLQEVL